MSLPEDPSAVFPATINEARQPAVPGQENNAPPGTILAPGSSVRMWTMVLGAGLLAGLTLFALGEIATSLVRASPDLPPEIASSGIRAAAEMERRLSISRDQTATLAYGGLGMVLGLALGAAGGLSRRSM